MVLLQNVQIVSSALLTLGESVTSLLRDICYSRSCITLNVTVRGFCDIGDVIKWCHNSSICFSTVAHQRNDGIDIMVSVYSLKEAEV